MRKYGLIALIIIVAVFAVFSFSGCARKMAEGLVEKAIEKAAEQEGDNVDVDISDEGITIQGEEDGEEVNINISEEGMTIEGQEGEEEVNVNISEEGMTVEGEEGESEFTFGGTDIPDDWPSEVAVNPDIAIAFSATDTTDGKQSFTITGSYDGPGKDLFDWYISKFGGWTEDYNTVMDSSEGKSYTVQFSNDNFIVSIMIVEADSEVTIVQTVSEN